MHYQLGADTEGQSLSQGALGLKHTHSAFIERSQPGQQREAGAMKHIQDMDFIERIMLH